MLRSRCLIPCSSIPVEFLNLEKRTFCPRKAQQVCQVDHSIMNSYSYSLKVEAKKKLAPVGRVWRADLWSFCLWKVLRERKTEGGCSQLLGLTCQSVRESWVSNSISAKHSPLFTLPDLERLDYDLEQQETTVQTRFKQRAE